MPNFSGQKSVHVLGCIVVAFALLYVYVLPIFLSPDIFERVNEGVESLLIALVVLYLYYCKSTTIPWLVILILSVGEFYHQPAKGMVMALLSLALALTPLS